jgi:hypothetical protein
VNNGAIVIDGVDDEPVWAQANEIEVTYEDISDHHDPVCYETDNEYDIGAKYKLLYDDTALYIYVNVVDDEVFFVDVDHGCGQTWSYDGIEIYFITTNNADEGQTVGGVNNVGGMHLRIQINSDNSVALASGGEYDIISSIAMSGEEYEGYVAEIAINLEAFLSFRVDEPVTITPGETQMGFDAFVNDSDEDQYYCPEECRSSLQGWNNHDNGVYNDASKSGKMNFSDQLISGIYEVNSLSATFEVFPNPAQDIIYINSEAPISEIRIVNLLGKQVLRVTDYTGEIDISGLGAGVYFVAAEGTTQMFVVE